MGTASNHDSFVLRWNEFQSNMANNISALRAEEDFLDVTVAVDEQHQVQAHRVILAASSGFFKGLLKRNPAPHPVLVMPPGVRFSELAHLVDFMYHGEVSILQDDIESFMKLAEMLKVKGLVEEERDSEESLPPPQRMPKMPPGINVRRRTTPGPPPSQPPHSGAKRPKMDGRKGADVAASAAASKRDYGGDDMNSGEYMHAAYEAQVPSYQSHDEQAYEQHMMTDPIPSTSASTAPPQVPVNAPTPNKSTRLIALQCPHCPSRLPGVESFKDHISRAHPKVGEPSSSSISSSGTPGMSLATPQAGGLPSSPSKSSSDVPVRCDFCDKHFKSTKNMKDHVRRIHKSQVQAEGEVMAASDPNQPQKKRGRPKKSALEMGPPPPLST